jgi:hypothetical protein
VATALSVILLTMGCGGGDSPSPGATAPSNGGAASNPTPTPTPTPEPTPQAGPAPPLPSLQTCALGPGSYYTTCDRTEAELLDSVDLAVARVMNEYPSLFDFDDFTAPGSFMVLNPEGFINGVVNNLREDGFCAEFDGIEVQIRGGNDFSEQYDVILSSGHARRGYGSYRATCIPPAFPVVPTQAINYVRVSFYEINCPEGVVPPGTNFDLLYVGCVGKLTATPKDALGHDVPSRIHGPDIEWELRRGGDEGVVTVRDDRNQDFNKKVDGLAPGDFQLCATVQGVEGCLNGRVE